MQKLNYSVIINAEKSHVWDTMLDPEKYPQWVKAFSANSQFVGEWKRDAIVKFIDPNMGGTKAILEEFEPYECILAKHISMVNKDGSEETENEMAKKWIGTTEKYIFKELKNSTELIIEMNTHCDFSEMFNNCWPKALELLKGLSEKR